MLLLRNSIVFFLFCLLCFSCREEFKSVQKFDITTLNNPKSGDTAIYDPKDKFYFSRITRPSCGGLNAPFKIEEVNRNKRIWVIFKGRARTNYAQSNASISVAAIGLNQMTVVWKAIFLRYYITDLNTWCPFKDSVLLPREKLEQKYSLVNTIAYLGNSNSEMFDVDTLHVEYKIETEN